MRTCGSKFSIATGVLGLAAGALAGVGCGQRGGADGVSGTTGRGGGSGAGGTTSRRRVGDGQVHAVSA